MYPLLTMLLIPTLAAMLASEKEKGLLDMVKMEGGRTDAFFRATLLPFRSRFSCFLTL